MTPLKLSSRYCWICGKELQFPYPQSIDCCKSCKQIRHKNTKKGFGLINTYGMISEPICEAEVVFLFSHIYQNLGLKNIIRINSQSVDFICTNKTGSPISIEIEYDLTRIRSHFKSNIDQISWIIYWKEGKITPGLLNHLKDKKLIDLRRFFINKKHNSKMFLPKSVLRQLPIIKTLNCYKVIVNNRFIL